MRDLASVVPAGSIAAALVVVIGYLLNGNREDRKVYREALNAEVALRVDERARSDKDVAAERARAEAAEERIDREMELRRAEQERGAALATEITILTAQVRQQNVKIADLRHQLSKLQNGGSS